MDWTRDLPGWSHPSLSRQVAVAPHRWHVQEAGSGPTILLLPGAGASVHTWRHLIPQLAQSYHVVAVDLPGQGFTRSPNATRSGLEETSADLVTLIRHESWKIETIIGHSAGSAIALRLSQMLGTGKIVAINPALDTFDGVAGWLFPILAKFLALNPLTASFFSFGASQARARRLIDGTGSRIDEDGLSYYTRLIADRDHVNGALQMMARWSLDDLLRDLPTITAQCLFLTGENDAAVPPKVAARAAERMENAETTMLTGLGHLAHEEDPDRVLTHILRFLDGSDN